MRPPSVDSAARALTATSSLPQPLLVDAARAGIAESVAAGDVESAIPRAQGHARRVERALLGPVVNATGVLLHTNMGRAPRVRRSHDASAGGPDSAVRFNPAVRFNNVEFDVTSGARGSRRDIVGPLLARACGAEAVLIVNNCAAAVMLVLATLARGRGVVVSRGELVEIGGGFRIPEVMEQSGARLVEVGTTNRTRVADYAKALGAPSADVGLLLSVHRSNYRIEGFTETVSTAQLSELARASSTPVVVDIGSGLLDTATPWLADRSGHVTSLPWLIGEPAARQTLDDGADLVMFSGDKLLGGPQAGVIAGRKGLVDACARHPLARALRPGSLVLEDLQETVLAYLRADGRSIPFWRMATESCEALGHRATSLGFPVVDTEAVPGGGTLPGRTIPSIGVRVPGDVTRSLREHIPPIIARVENGATICDLRTVDPSDDALLGEALRAACTS